MDNTTILKNEIAKAVEIAWNTNGNAKDACVEAIIKYVFAEQSAKVRGGQTPIQTRYGALYYETPCRGESIYLCDDGSYVALHDKELELQSPNDHTEPQK